MCQFGAGNIDNAPPSVAYPWIDAENAHPDCPALGQLGENVVRNIKIGRDVLNIVIIIKRIEQL